MSKTVVIYVGRELPAWSLFAETTTGTPIDYSVGWTFAITIRQGDLDTAVAATVTANATPTSDTGSSGDIPSFTVGPNTGQLDSLTPGPATLIVVATSGGKDREHQYPAVVRT